MSRCCHIFDLIHDVETAMFNITSILKSRLNMCGALKTSMCSFLGVSSSGIHRYICILFTYVTKTK